MSIIYKIEPELGIIYYLFYSQCTSAGMLETMRETFRHPLRQARLNVIVDLLQAEMEVDLEDVRKSILLNGDQEQTGRGINQVAVLTQNRVLEIFSQTYELMSAKLPIKVKPFLNLQDSLPWLELTEHEERLSVIRAALFEQAKNAP